MRAIYLTHGEVAATTGKQGGLMLDKHGKTVGFDLYVEVAPNKWVHASQLPPGMLEEAQRRGLLSIGIVYNGKIYNYLNVRNIHDRLIASKLGLEASFKGEPSAFKAQIIDPIQGLAEQIQRVIQQLKQLKKLEAEAAIARVEELKARVKALEKKAGKTRQTEVEPHPLDFLGDLAKAFTGTINVEQVLLAQRIVEYIAENQDLLANPVKMAALRRMLEQA